MQLAITRFHRGLLAKSRTYYFKCFIGRFKTFFGKSSSPSTSLSTQVEAEYRSPEWHMQRQISLSGTGARSVMMLLTEYNDFFCYSDNFM